MKPSALLLAACAAVLIAARLSAQVCNVKVVTDANPDYADIGSLIHSITSNWTADKDKFWALWYWNKIARRQTAPMCLHGMELTDPVRQFNDYGFTMCSTVSGVNCSIWGAMGYDVRYWDISLHTVCEVKYDGTWHMYDSSMSALYTTCDGSRLASVEEIGQEGACAASDGKVELGHIAKYHCLTATSPNGFLTGADTLRSLAEESRCFNPGSLLYRHYLNEWSLGHRYILNLREGEVYTRTYRKLGDSAEYYVPNETSGKDPERVNPRYRIRGNGVRAFEPKLDGDTLAKVVHSMTGVRAVNPAGVAPVTAGQPGEVVFKIEGANVITSTVIRAAFLRRTAEDAISVAVSANNGMAWTKVWSADKQQGDFNAEIPLVKVVNGAYEVLVKVMLTGAADPMNAQLSSIRFDTITMLNSKTQPRLKIGKNTVYVGSGSPTESVVLWPDLQGDKYKENLVEEKNVACDDKHGGWFGSLHPVSGGEDGWVVYRLDTPLDMTTLTYGGRFYNRGQKGRIKMFHSFDSGKTWTESYAVPDTTSPWDVIHYVKADAPSGARSALVKYLMNSPNPGDTGHSQSIYAVRMEADYQVADPAFKPLEVTFTWLEKHDDYSTVKRSHTQLVAQVPFTYTINVGGADHPVMESLRTNLKGAVAGVAYGYSDGRDVGGEKFIDRWVTVGKVLSTGRPYTCTVPSGNNWGAGDPDGKKLTDGVVGPPYAGGASYAWSAIWPKGTTPVITVDMGQPTKCGAFRIDVGGYPFQDGILGQVKDKVEVLVSNDDKEYTSVGFFDFRLRWKDIPANYAWNDEETFNEHNYSLIPAKPVEARYVRFALTPSRLITVSEVQVLDSITCVPFDLKIALPDGKDRSDITQYNPKHTPSQPYKPAKRGN